MSGIAVFGGTFNPIHKGHLQMLNEIEKLDFIDRILVIPDNIPPHKISFELADDIHRVNMCKLAIRDIRKAVVDEREINRGGKSYTYDTLCSLKESNPDDDIYLVCGGDMLMSLDTWYRADELYKLCTIIAFSRTGISDSELNDKVRKLNGVGAKIIVIDSNIISVSSTEIRNAVKNGLPTDDLLSESVMKYITDNNIYR